MQAHWQVAKRNIYTNDKPTHAIYILIFFIRPTVKQFP